jgi:hypothetical protein
MNNKHIGNSRYIRYLEIKNKYFNLQQLQQLQQHGGECMKSTEKKYKSRDRKSPHIPRINAEG